MISVANPPVYLEVTDMIDTRIGFFGHVILCVSWNGSLDQGIQLKAICVHNNYYVYYFNLYSTVDDGNLSHFIVTATPDHMANVTNSMCGCKPWSQIVSHVSYIIIIIIARPFMVVGVMHAQPRMHEFVQTIIL